MARLSSTVVVPLFTPTGVMWFLPLTRIMRCLSFFFRKGIAEGERNLLWIMGAEKGQCSTEATGLNVPGLIWHAQRFMLTCMCMYAHIHSHTAHFICMYTTHIHTSVHTSHLIDLYEPHRQAQQRGVWGRCDCLLRHRGSYESK